MVCKFKLIKLSREELIISDEIQNDPFSFCKLWKAFIQSIVECCDSFSSYKWLVKSDVPLF